MVNIQLALKPSFVMREWVVHQQNKHGLRQYVAVTPSRCKELRLAQGNWAPQFKRKRKAIQRYSQKKIRGYPMAESGDI